MQLLQARKIAVEICLKLQPHCNENMLRIAGSIRRKSPEVKDIEIVAYPKVLFIHNLFHEVIGWQPVPEFSLLVKALGQIEAGEPTGRYMKILLPEGIKLDLFLPQVNDYYRQLAIRTGSALYSKGIAAAWVKKGWCGTEHGLRLITDCFKDEQGNWHLVNKQCEKPPRWGSEEEFFNWLGIPFLDPVARNL